MRNLIVLLLVLVCMVSMSACGSGESDGEENSYTTATSNENNDATCYYTVDSEGNYIEVGEVGSTEGESELSEDYQPDEPEVIEVDWEDESSVLALKNLPKGTFFVASCTGDVNISFDNDTVTTTAGGD